MTMRWRIWIHPRVLILVGLLLAGTVSFGWISTASAADPDSQLGIVIGFDGERVEYLLFDIDPESDQTAMDLMIESGLELEIAPFGGLGEAVCSIDGTGCPGSDCFCESFSSPAYYWQFFLWDGNQWVPQHQGASQHTVEAGEILGWSWTAEPPGLPDVSFSDLAESQESDDLDASTVVPDAAPTPTEETAVPEPAADGSEPESADDSGASGLECLQFISVLTVGTAILGLLGRRRYGSRAIR
jgi:hypothetical protein